MRADRVAGCRGDWGPHGRQHDSSSISVSISSGGPAPRFGACIGELLGAYLSWLRTSHPHSIARTATRSIKSSKSKSDLKHWPRNNMPLLRGTTHRPRGEFGRQVFSAAERATCQKWGTRQPKAEPKTAAAVIEGDAAGQAIGQPIGQGPRTSRSPSLVLLWSVRPSRQQRVDSERLLTPIFSLAMMNAGWWPRMSEN